MLSREQVEHVAILARLALSEMETEAMQAQLFQILEHFQVLETLNTVGVEPTAQAIPLHNVMREDQVEESLSLTDVLANAPRKEGGHLVVPAVLPDD